MTPRSSLVLAAGCAAALALTACSSSSPGSSATTSTSASTAAVASAATPSTAPAGSSASTTGASASPATTSGSVSVLYAGSLQDLMLKSVVPGFAAATPFTAAGFGAGSSALAADIKGKIKVADVFVSASKKADESLMGTADAAWVSWYATFASSELVLGYNPKSSFAAALKTKPWYDVVTEPGFRIGFTDPATDPKGVLAVQALTDTATGEKLPALKTIAGNTKNEYPETALTAQLASGQLDAAFFYQAEANSADIVTVPLTGTDLKATYTLTVVKGAPNPAGANAFITYLLGPAGRAAMTKDGFVLASPITVTGSGVPAALTSVLK